MLLLKVAGGIIILLLIAGILVTTIFGNDIKQLVINEINKRLKTEVRVNGEIEFSIYRNFPFASVTFHNVEVRESFPESKKNLLKTERVDILFNLIDIWRKNYVIKKIVVGKGNLNVRINKSGKPNYTIFKSSEDTSKFSVDIRSISFSDLDVEYDDKLHEHLYSLQFHQGELSGIFSDTEFELKLESAFFCRNLFISSKDFLKEKEVELESRFLINTEKGTYKIKNAKLAIQGIHFSVDGTVQEKPKSTFIDFSVTAEKSGIESFAGILPNEYGKYLREYRSKGNISLSGTIRGDYSEKVNPEINFRFAVKGGSISHEKLSSSFQNVNLTVLYSNGPAKNLRSSLVAFKDGNATFRGKPIQASFEMKDFINPFLNFKINTSLDLKEMFPLFHLDDVNDMSGELILNNIYYSGYAKALNSKVNLAATQAGGEVVLKNVNVSANRSEIENINGSLKLDRNNFIINDLKFNAGKSDLQLSGRFVNLIPYLLSLNADSNESASVGIDVTVNSDILNWEELLKPQMDKATNTPPSEDVIPAAFDMLNGKVAANIRKFSYDKFRGENIQGTVLFTADNIFFNNISLNAESGSIVANGKLDKSDKDALKLESSFTFSNINIHQLFYECNNWGQDAITDKNLQGIASSTFVLKAGWNKATFDDKQLVVVGDISIDKGELNDFAPMKALSAFVKISDLEHIRFSRLSNQVEIRNRTVNIPMTKISTNVLNLEVSGSHTFDNMIDYKVKLNLLQLLTNKFKLQQLDPETMEKTPDGLLNLFITMKGEASNPVIQYDKRAVKEKIKQDMQAESKNLKQILKEEFNQQKKQQDKIKEWKAPEEYEYMQFDTTDTDNH